MTDTHWWDAHIISGRRLLNLDEFGKVSHEYIHLRRMWFG